MRYVKAREWTKEDFEQIKLLYENGNSIAYIAKQFFHCREATISKIIKENDARCFDNFIYIILISR